jgi:hypothetical protein
MEPSVTRMAPPPPTDFSPQASLWQRGPRVKPQAHRRAHQVGAQPECHTQNMHHGEPSEWRRHIHDPKGPRSSVWMAMLNGAFFYCPWHPKERKPFFCCPWHPPRCPGWQRRTAPLYHCLVLGEVGMPHYWRHTGRRCCTAPQWCF